MKKLLTLTVLAVLGLSCVRHGAAGDDPGWMTDFEAAMKAAKERNVPILADFSGSDWCGWCIKLDKEVFAKEEFKVFADKNLVRFLADFPAHKKLATELEAQNKGLSEKYKIQGFPTVLLLSADGDILARTGYRRGGPEAYVAHLKELIEGAAK